MVNVIQKFTNALMQNPSLSVGMFVPFESIMSQDTRCPLGFYIHKAALKIMKTGLPPAQSAAQCSMLCRMKMRSVNYKTLSPHGSASAN